MIGAVIRVGRRLFMRAALTGENGHAGTGTKAGGTTRDVSRGGGARCPGQSRVSAESRGIDSATAPGHTFAPARTRAFALVLALAAAPAGARAQGVQVTATIEPAEIQVGDSAQLSVEVSMQGSGISLQSINVAPVDGLRIEPQGQSQNFQITNGAVSMVFTQTYVVLAQRAGHYTIGPAQAGTSAGSSASGTVQLDVDGAPGGPGGPAGPGGTGGGGQTQGGTSPGSSGGQGAGPEGPGSRGGGPQGAGSQGTGSPGAVRQGGGAGSGSSPGNGSRTRPPAGAAQGPWLEATISRTQIFEGEAVLYQSRLYSPYDVAHAQVSRDGAFTGFRVEPIKTENAMARVERGGQPLITAPISRRLLIATRAGRFTIQPETLQVALRQARRRPVDPFDVFDGDPFDIFGRIVQREVTAPEVTVEVLPLPRQGRPADFSGLVGSEVVLSAHADKQEVKAGEVITYTLTVRGCGDLGALPEPRLDFGADFKQYPVKSTKQIQTSEQGLKGTRTFEYVLAPLRSGAMTLPGASLSYFDTSTHQYRRLQTPGVTVSVTGVEHEDRLSAGVGTGHEVELLGSDLVFIKDDLELSPLEAPAYKQPGWWVGVLVPPALLGLAFGLEAMRRRRAGDVRAVRASRALRKARAELDGVEAAMATAPARDLYAHVEAALAGFVKDKLDLPHAGQAIPELREALEARAVPADRIDRLARALERCQEVRFASAGARIEPQDLAEARALLDALEEALA